MKFKKVVYFNGKYVAVPVIYDTDNTTLLYNNLYYSDDLETWTQCSMGTYMDHAVADICVGKNYICCIDYDAGKNANNQYISTSYSTDGITFNASFSNSYHRFACAYDINNDKYLIIDDIGVSIDNDKGDVGRNCYKVTSTNAVAITVNNKVYCANNLGLSLIHI